MTDDQRIERIGKAARLFALEAHKAIGKAVRDEFQVEGEHNNDEHADAIAAANIAVVQLFAAICQGAVKERKPDLARLLIGTFQEQCTDNLFKLAEMAKTEG